jgi:uncharacterized protein DUF6983
MPQLIPIIPDPTANDVRLSVALDGRSYVLDFSWSDRSQSWYLDLYAVTSAPVNLIPVIAGKRISCFYPPLAGTPGDARPPGELVPFDLTDSGIDPTHDELGARVVLAYYTAAELGR